MLEVHRFSSRLMYAKVAVGKHCNGDNYAPQAGLNEEVMDEF